MNIQKLYCIGGGKTRSITRFEANLDKLGFTLAEVLITLGIIGVVAAMTIPNLITTHQKKVTVTKIQKAISTLTQAYRLAYDEVGEATAEEAKEMGAVDYFEKYWAPYLKTAHVCKDYRECGYSQVFPYKYSSGIDFPLKFHYSSGRVPFYLADGTVYLILTDSGNTGEATPNSQIFVDINGGKQPNKLGKDVFVLERIVDDTKGGMVVPMCSSRTTVECPTTGKTGYCCLEVIRRAGWQIDKSYPW